MTIALFDKFLNTLPQSVLEAKDISMVIMIDPPEGLPPMLLAGKGILSTEDKTISVYNADGTAVAHTFDISTTDLKPITEELAAVKATAEAADSLSKENKGRLDAIDLSKYAELDGDVQFNTVTLKSKLSFTNPEGEEIDFVDALKFNNSGFTKLSILNGSVDLSVPLSMGGSNQIINLASGGDNDSNAATIGDAKRISTEGSGLKPTEGEWDMLSLPVTNVATSEEETSAATVGQVNAVDEKVTSVKSTADAADALSKANEQKINNLPAPPDLSNYIQNGDDAELTSVSFTEDSSIHFRPESGLILEADSICGEDTGGNKTFIIKDGEFDLKTKVITNVSDGVNATDAATKGQLDAVEGKADANASTISGVKSTADAADALSKQNKTTLDNLPPDPTPRVAELEANALQKGETGFDAKSFKVVNLDSGDDVDSNAANIGDVKRIATEGSGLKPTDNEWDMLELPIINVAESEEETSAATVGQVKEVESKIPNVSNFVETGTTATLNAVMFGGDTKVDYQDELGLVLQGDTIYGKSQSGYEHFFIEDGNFNVKSKKIQKVRDGVADDDAATVSQVNAVDGKVTEAKSVADSAKSKADANEGSINSLTETVTGNTTTIGQVKTTADNADSLSKTNAGLLENALLSDEYGWDVNNLNVYNVSRLSRTNNAVNSSGLSIGDVDVNLHADTVGITNSNSSSTYAVFSAGGLNLNDYPLTRMGSGGDTDTNAANIGDVKRIATDSGGGLKPTDSTWDMLGYPVLNIGTSDVETSAATVAQVNTVDGKVAGVKSTADAADTLSKDNKTRLDNLPPVPDLSGYVKNGDDVNFGTADINIVKVTKGDDPSKFSDILIDGNTNTQMNFVGDTHFYVRNKSDNSKGLEALQIDSSARLVAKQKIKTPIITNLSTGTTNSNTDKASFIDLTEDNVAKVGAKNSLLFDVGGNLSAGVYPDHVNFNTDYVTGVKMRDVGSRQPYDAVNWETLQGFSPDLDGYAKLDDTVQFARVNIKNDFASDNKNPYLWCDPANGNTVFGATGSVYFNQYDHDGVKHRWALVDASNRLLLDNATKVHRLMNKNTWSTNSDTDKAGFVRFDLDNRIIVGAKQDITLQVNGKDVYKVKETGIDFTGLGGTAAIHHDHNIDVSVGDTKNVAFKSGGMKLLAAMDADGKNINHSGDLSFNAGKKLKGSDVGNLIIENLGGIHRNHTNDANSVTLGNGTNTYKSNGHLFHDNNGNEVFFVGNNVNVNSRKLQNVAKSETDADATNLGHIKELIAAGGGGGVDYENYITRSQSGSTTFYETTDGQQNAWVVATDSTFQGAMTYTFDYSRQGQEVVVGVENRTKGSVIAKLYSRQATVLTVEVPSYHVFTARYVPDIGKYVYNIGSWFPTTQRVITLDEITPTISSDYKQMTKNIIAAMPNHTTLIGYHNPDIDGASKYKFVTTGKTGTGKEGSKCAVVIHKHTSNHAVGLSTTEGSSGRVYSRVLDGTSGIWNTNDTSASFALEEDIPLDSIPEDQIFFTGDNGVLESYIVDEDTGEMALRPLEGYNVPKHESDIAALEVQTEKNRSQTHYFINEGSLSYDWPDEERRPLVDVFILNSTQTIEGSSITVTDNASHKYSGEYNTVGSVCINSSGNWTVQYCYHNCYKKADENWYVVVNQATQTWQIIEAENPHTSIGEKAANVTVNLGSVKSLPYSFGDYTIDPNFDSIDSLEFLKGEVGVQYDDVNSRVLINFNGANPSGYVVLK